MRALIRKADRLRWGRRGPHTQDAISTPSSVCSFRCLQILQYVRAPRKTSDSTTMIHTCALNEGPRSSRGSAERSAGRKGSGATVAEGSAMVVRAAVAQGRTEQGTDNPAHPLNGTTLARARLQSRSRTNADAYAVCGRSSRCAREAQRGDEEKRKDGPDSGAVPRPGHQA